MTPDTVSPFQAWESFYVIVGSSAGALTGLQFVVMTLIAQLPAARTRGETLSAFGTPNVVHFCAALLLSSILSIPWRSPHGAGVALLLCGIAGVVYSLIVTRRAHRQRGYQPVFEDWLWHVALPVIAYATLLVSGGVLFSMSGSGAAPFVIGFATLLLVFIGVHNAWDTVTYLMIHRQPGEDAPSSAAAPAAPATETPASAPSGAGPR